MSNGSDKEMPKVWFELMAAISQRESLRKTLPIIEPSAPPKPPYEFHGFEVTAWALGGMGMVLLGRDPKLDRRVAIKLLQSSGPEADAALIAEAKTLAKLSHHPNVVTVHAVMEWEGGVFFVMEFIDGMNGKQWLEQRPTWQEVLGVFIDAGEGLAAAHDKGIQHGDFKPANMLIGKDGRTRVADFGIADYLRVDDGDEPRTGRRAGTPKYMAPERLRGQQGDARSDQFSFCVAMWHALHRWRPYGGETVFQLLDAIEAGEIRPGDSFARVPYWLTRAVRKGLAEDPDERYSDMHELLHVLKTEPPDDDHAIDKPDDGGPVEHEGRLLHAPATPAGAAPQRDRWTYGVIGFLLAAVAGMGLTVLMRSPESRPEPVAEPVKVEPYHAILEAVAADDFAEAERLWRRHELQLTDVQTLQIADTCLERANALAATDPTKATLGALTAQELALAVGRYGNSPEARTAGGQLATESTKWLETTRGGAD